MNVKNKNEPGLVCATIEPVQIEQQNSERLYS